MQDQQFERTLVNMGDSQHVIVTSWYDHEKRHWRANAPALLHILTPIAGRPAEEISGATREKAIVALRSSLRSRTGDAKADSVRK